MTTYIFEEVKRHAQKSGRCVVCGKQANRQTVFYQTLNPFNRAADGTPKIREQITEELEKEVVTWRSRPVVHAKSETAS